MMDVLYCILNDSPEALNMMKEEHIKIIISLLEKFGRDPKVRCPTVYVAEIHERRPVFVSCARLKHALAVLDPTDAEDHLS